MQGPRDSHVALTFPGGARGGQPPRLPQSGHDQRGGAAQRPAKALTDKINVCELADTAGHIHETHDDSEGVCDYSLISLRVLSLAESC